MESREVDALVECLEHRPPVLAGAEVIGTASSAKHATLLLSGVACSYKRLEDGSRQIHSFYYAGDFADLYGYILPQPDEAIAAQALTDCLVATVDYSAIQELVARYPNVGLALWRATMLEASMLRERLLNVRRGSAQQRVASLLCEQLARREAIGITNPIVPIKQVDIADAAVLSVVHVNRIIQALRRRNVLSRASPVIEVIDRKQLAKVAGFDGRYLGIPQLVPEWAAVPHPPAADATTA
jgi:CRP-like cAMP-binding protein